jgi:hypothetical protein
MPMQLPQRARLKRNNRRSNGFRDREVATVNSLDRSSAARNLFGSDLTRLEDVGAVAFEFAVG